MVSHDGADLSKARPQDLDVRHTGVLDPSASVRAFLPGQGDMGRRVWATDAGSPTCRSSSSSDRVCSGCGSSGTSVGCYSDSSGGVPLPAAMIAEMVTYGVAPDAAASAAVWYYKAKSNEDVMNRAQCNTLVGAARRSARLERWRDEVAAMTNAPGQCYLAAVRYSRRPAYARALGPYPELQQFVGMLEEGDLDVSAVKALSVYRVPSDGNVRVCYHIGHECADGERVGSALDVIGTMLTKYPFVNDEFSLREQYDTVVGLPLVGIVGGKTRGTGRANGERLPVVPLSDDLELIASGGDPLTKCKLHSVPRRLSVGLCPDAVGTALPVAAAAEHEVHECTLPEVKRAGDVTFVKFVSRPSDPGMLLGWGIQGEFELLGSDIPSTMESFGAGYCYLRLMHPRYRWRVARVLGPNPRVLSVARVMLWAGREIGDGCRIYDVGGGNFHVEDIPGSAWDPRAIYQFMLDCLQTNINIRVGRDLTRHAPRVNTPLDIQRVHVNWTASYLTMSMVDVVSQVPRPIVETDYSAFDRIIGAGHVEVSEMEVIVEEMDV